METQYKILPMENCIKCAIFTFIGGSLLFLLHSFTNLLVFAYIGVLYICIAALINISYLRTIFKSISSFKEQYPAVIATILLMLLNVPIFILYCWLSMDSVLNAIQ